MSQKLTVPRNDLLENLTKKEKKNYFGGSVMEADDSVGNDGVDDLVLDTCFVLRFRDDVVVVVVVVVVEATDGIGVDDAFGTCGDDSLINSFDGVESLDELSLLLELMLSTFFPLTEAESFHISIFSSTG